MNVLAAASHTKLLKCRLFDGLFCGSMKRLCKILSLKKVYSFWKFF
jgi:hypothetical protein